jgi:hypothetical protein
MRISELSWPAAHAGAETSVELDDHQTVQHGLHRLLVRVGRQVHIILDLNRPQDVRQIGTGNQDATIITEWNAIECSQIV